MEIEGDILPITNNQLSTSRVGICFGPASGLSIGQVLLLAQKAEKVGFESLWTGEFSNDCLAWGQALGSATQQARIGTSIVNIYLRHPAVVAAAAAVIDELSGGRLVLGLGISHRSIVEESLGLALTQPLAYLEEYVRVVRAVLSGEPVYHQGEFFKLQDYQLGAKPPRPHLPIYVAVLGLTAAERAARYADGVILTLTPPGYVSELVMRLQDNARAAGREPESLEVVQIVPCFFSDQFAVAELAARRMICRYVSLPFYGNMFAKAGFEAEVAEIGEALAAGAEARAWQAVSPAMIEGLAAVGDWAACQQVIERYRQAGAHTVVLYPNAVTGDTARDWDEAINLTLASYQPT